MPPIAAAAVAWDRQRDRARGVEPGDGGSRRPAIAVQCGAFARPQAERCSATTSSRIGSIRRWPRWSPKPDLQRAPCGEVARQWPLVADERTTDI